MKSNNNTQLTRGFTIIELLVVIVVIGILASIGIVSYGGISDRAIITSLQSDLTNASDQLVIDQAHSSAGTFPASLAQADNGAGITSSADTTYQYTVNNTNTPKTFCLTATKNNQSYNINQEGIPFAGPCPVLWLDAGIATSYPGTGTVLTDLSGNGKNGVLSGGVGYSSGSGGSLVFDGVNDTINLGTGNTFFPLPSFSMELWFKSDGTTPTTGTSPGLLGITYGIRLLVFSSYLQFAVDDGASFPALNTAGANSFYNSSWHQVVIQANAATRYIYLDGLLSNTSSATWSGVTRYPTNSANIGRDNNNSNYYFTGNISSIKFYNVVLSANDINQNFNKLRGRYGL